MSAKDPRLIELRRQVRELRAARDAGVFAGVVTHDLLVPDPVEFALSPAYLAQPRLYPRQGTVLKTFFLRQDLFTDFDREVLEEWMSGFTRPARPAPQELHRGWYFEGSYGLAPDIFERIALLNAQGRFSFREIVLAIGRRGGKGHLGAICGAYDLWRVVALGDPHDYFELPAGKVISASVFGASQPLARANQWLDLVGTIVAAPCFAPLVQKLTKDRLVLATPADLENPTRRWSGSIEIVARETTEIAGRGAASIVVFFDELAHITSSTSPVDADRLYEAAVPALDQFRGFELIFEGSSPAQQTGAFFNNYRRGLAMDPVTGTAQNPEILVMQMPSFALYADWERAASIPTRPDDAVTVGSAPVPEMFPEIRRPVQTYDEQMRRLEADNPAKFRVERLGEWAHVEDPYLNPAVIERMFGPYDGRMPTFQESGALGLDYVAHGDPATRHDRFSWVIGHREGPDDEGLHHAWIDVIRYWSPTNFDDNEIDFLALQDVFFADIRNFYPYSVTFDQYSSVPIIQTLQQRVDRAELPKRVTFDQRPHTHTGNQQLAEVFRTALGAGLVHCPYDRLLDDELRFLQERNGRVDHPDTGPVTTNDVAVSAMVVVRELIGYENGFAIREVLSNLTPSGTNLPDRLNYNPFQDFNDFQRLRNQRWPRGYR